MLCTKVPPRIRITLGNQLDGTYLVDPEVVERYRKRYPNGIDNKGDAS
eukprot:TsM_000433400 transcript=TsM_000433400 gene=TsM_000433400